MGKSAEVIYGKGVANLHGSQRVRKWMKTQEIDPNNGGTLEGPDEARGTHKPRLQFEGQEKVGKRMRPHSGGELFEAGVMACGSWRNSEAIPNEPAWIFDLFCRETRDPECWAWFVAKVDRYRGNSVALATMGTHFSGPFKTTL